MKTPTIAGLMVECYYDVIFRVEFLIAVQQAAAEVAR